MAPAGGLAARLAEGRRGVLTGWTPLTAVLVVFLGTRLVIWFLAWVGYVLVPAFSIGARSAVANAAFLSQQPLIDLWFRGDGISYLVATRPDLWLNTFAAAGGTMPLPVLPVLVGAFQRLIGSGPLAALVVVNFALVLALVGLDGIVTPRFGRSVTIRSAVLLLVFPFAFRLATAEPFSLVLGFAVVAFLGVESDWPWLSAGAAALAALSHPLGLAVWPASVVAKLGRKPRGSSIGRRLSGWVSLAVAPAAVAGYGVYLHRQAGLSNGQIARTFLGVPGYPLASALSGTDSRALAFFVGLNVLAGVVIGITTPRVLARLGSPYAAYQIGLVVLAVLGNPTGLGAAATLAFPAFIVMASMLERRELYEASWLSVSAMSLGLATALAAAWYPVAGGLAAPPLTDSRMALAGFHARLLAAEPQRSTLPADLYDTADRTFLFLGYDPIPRRASPGQTLPIRIYAYTLKAPEQGYVLSARLHDVNGLERARFDKTLWGTVDQVLFTRTTDPALVPGQFFREEINMPIDSDVPPGAYTLDLQLFAIPTFAAVPVVDESNRQSDRLFHASLVVASEHDFGPAGSIAVPQPSDAQLGDAIHYLGFEVTSPNPDRTVDVALYWQAITQPSANYTVFVQALDANGRLVAQSDSYPWSGGLPTTAWLPGWTIRDVHRLQLPPERNTSPLHVIAGMYRLETMQRLPVRIASSSAVADHLDLAGVPLQ
jgi:hypothetical protein